MDVLVIGTAVVDIMALGMPHQDDWKEKQRIDQIKLLVGGDGANQSIHLADEGRDVTLCASVGCDGNSDMLEGLLRKRGVQTEFARKEDVVTGTAMVLVGKDGNRNTFSVKGAHSELSIADLPDLEALGENRPKAISIASLFSLPILEKEGLLEYLMQAKEYGIKVFADLGSDKLHQGLNGIRKFLPYITYFMPSFYDAADMTGAECVEDIAEKYLRLGCENVIIKCGEEGCYYASLDECGRIPALSVEPVDTTGAGDCMVALLISRILMGDTMKEACEYACKGASISTLYAGASVENITEKL